MNGYTSILLLATLPVLGNWLGTAIAEFSRLPRWVVGAALHAAAGVAVALVGIELLPRALEGIDTALFLLLFCVGALVSYGLAQLACSISRVVEGGSAGAWMVYMATAADLLSDGLMTGAGSAVSTELGVLLALSQVVANLPAGFATISNFRSQKVRRRTRLLIAASFILPVFVGVGIGFAALRGAGATVQSGALAVIVGVLLLATIEDLVPQADKPGATRATSSASFVAGFAFFAALVAYVG